MATTAIKPVIGKKRLLVNHEGSKEILTLIFEYKSINEIRVDYDEKCVKILTSNAKSYEIIFENSDKQQLNNFHRALITSMSGITQEELLRARQLADKRASEQAKTNKLKIAKDKK